MKNFLAIFTGSPDSQKSKDWANMDPKQQKERGIQGMIAWKNWAENNKSIIVHDGGPLSVTKKITEEGIFDIHNQMAAFTLITSNSHEEAAKLFINHPHFSIFPGDGVEIMEVLPIPQMN